MGERLSLLSSVEGLPWYESTPVWLYLWWEGLRLQYLLYSVGLFLGRIYTKL